MLEIAVLVSGGGTNLQAIIDGITEGTITDTRIKAVISNNKNAYALERARKNGISGISIAPADFSDRQDFHKELLSRLKELEVDLIVLAGYLVVVPEAVVKAFKGKIINIHPSLIPAFCGKGYYGLKVHEGVLERGVKITGATVHFVDEGTDTGPIILQKAVAVEDGDTAEILQRRVMEQAEWEILPQAIDLIAKDALIVKGKQVWRRIK